MMALHEKIIGLWSAVAMRDFDIKLLTAAKERLTKRVAVLEHRLGIDYADNPVPTNAETPTT